MPAFDITIAGEVNLDLILYGFEESIPVDREILASNFEMTLGSSSAILAHNLAVLGARVGFVTRYGADETGRIAMDRLAEGGVDTSRCVRGAEGSKTGITLLLPHGRSRRILTYPGVMFDLTCDDLDIEYLAAAPHFHLSSLFLLRGLHAGLPARFRALKRRGVTLSLDTNDDPDDHWDGVLEEILSLVDIFLPNDDEIRRIARRDTVEEALDVLSATVPLIAVKCGRQGALVQQGGRRVAVPAVSVDPIDTIGAGDSFNAGFLAAWLRGATAEVSALAGNITGALSTQKPGGTEAFRDPALRDAFLRQHAFPVPRKSPA
ncbi:MAG TPA: sugar kinase [Acidobacteriaceae bacterium]|jgi:sugar/nucleoside kinase (ribokinase family)|nr:sugar kinase [Acidobacteriaceae bacterium]